MDASVNTKVPTYRKLSFNSEGNAKNAAKRMEKDYPNAVIKQTGTNVFYPKKLSKNYAQEIKNEFDTCI